MNIQALTTLTSVYITCQDFSILMLTLTLNTFLHAAGQMMITDPMLEMQQTQTPKISCIICKFAIPT